MKTATFKTHLSVRDATQFEIALRYLWPKNLRTKKIGYRTTVTFDFPKQMKIDSFSYPKESFFQDMKPYIRFEVPFKKIHSRNEIPKVLDLKLDACAILKRVAKLERQFSKFNLSATKTERLLRELCKTIAMAKMWRSDLKDLISQDDERWQIDEFICYRLLEVIGLSFDQNVIADEKAELREWMQSRAYFLPSQTNSITSLEQFNYRYGALKRYVQRPLFLELRENKHVRFRQQIGPILAAGLAGCWGIMIQMYISNSAISTLHSVSTSTAIIVGTLTLGYIIKDRIKEWGKAKFKMGVFAKIPDVSDDIYIPLEGKKNQIIGRSTESVQYGKFTKTLEETATRIFYRKHISLFPKKISRLYNRPPREMYDCLRFNIDNLTRFMAAPLVEKLMLNDQDQIQCLSLPKTYPIDVSIKIEPLHVSAKAKYQEFRVILSKRGIERIEEHESSDDSNENPIKATEADAAQQYDQNIHIEHHPHTSPPEWLFPQA